MVRAVVVVPTPAQVAQTCSPLKPTPPQASQALRPRISNRRLPPRIVSPTPSADHIASPNPNAAPPANMSWAGRLFFNGSATVARGGWRHGSGSCRIHDGRRCGGGRRAVIEIDRRGPGAVLGRRRAGVFARAIVAVAQGCLDALAVAVSFAFHRFGVDRGWRT